MHYTTSHNTQSSVPEDGENNFPKYVELTGIINRSLLLHVYIIYISFFLRLDKQSQFILLHKVLYFIALSFLVRKIFTFYINDVRVFKCPFPGPKVKLFVNKSVLSDSFMCYIFCRFILFFRSFFCLYVSISFIVKGMNYYAGSFKVLNF